MRGAWLLPCCRATDLLFLFREIHLRFLNAMSNSLTEKPPVILLVDDNLQNLQVLGTMLKKNDYFLTVANNGIKALESAVKTPPELILLDIIMPDLDGLETCRRLKNDERTMNIPVIFISALSSIHSKLQAFHAGGVDYITKPFIQEEVLARIQVHIKLKQAMERMAAMAITDELTGAYNRRFAYEVLRRELKHMEAQSQQPDAPQTMLTLCYIDIDNLKVINDTLGHNFGDKLIITVVNALKSALGPLDYLFRMGGDEFLLLFPGALQTDAEELLARTRSRVNQEEIMGKIVDFSYGCTQYSFHADGPNVDDLIRAADKKMFREKSRKKVLEHEDATVLPQANLAAPR